MTASNAYASLTEVKNWIAITSTSTTDDSVIEDMMEGASRLIDKLAGGRTFYVREETHYYSAPNSAKLFIDDDDLYTLKTLKNGDGTTISSSDYHLLPKNKNPKYAIQLTSASNWVSDPDDYEIEAYGSWGYSATAPDDIKQACIDIVVNAYHRRFGQGQAGTTVIAGGGILVTPEDIPGAAMAIIRHYRRLV